MGQQVCIYDSRRVCLYGSVLGMEIPCAIYIRPKKHFKNEQRSKDAAAKKNLRNTSGVGKINNHYEDIYIPDVLKYG